MSPTAATPAGRPPLWRITLTCALAALAGVLLAASAGLVHFDHVRGAGLTATTYGVSAGTDARYCSLEISGQAAGAGIDIWCQLGG